MLRVVISRGPDVSPTIDILRHMATNGVGVIVGVPTGVAFLSHTGATLAAFTCPFNRFISYVCYPQELHLGVNLEELSGGLRSIDSPITLETDLENGRITFSDSESGEVMEHGVVEIIPLPNWFDTIDVPGIFGEWNAEWNAAPQPEGHVGMAPMTFYNLLGLFRSVHLSLVRLIAVGTSARFISIGRIFSVAVEFQMRDGRFIRTGNREQAIDINFDMTLPIHMAFMVASSICTVVWIWSSVSGQAMFTFVVPQYGNFFVMFLDEADDSDFLGEADDSDSLDEADDANFLSN